MRLAERIEALGALGDYLKGLDEPTKSGLFRRAEAENPWFTQDSIAMAWEGILYFLNTGRLTQWTSKYMLEPAQARKVGLVMAGNIPMVGFHDLLSVIVSGHTALVKLSSQDTVLMRFIAHSLAEVQPALSNKIEMAERLNAMEAVIATGSDNSSRYFEYYFSKVPNIIRKNRTSVAIISGEESDSDLLLLGQDMFSYFGLGCRNVSKLFVPATFDMTVLLDAVQPFSALLDHYKYKNNYDYHKSILLVNQEPHLDTGFSLFRESDDMVSPVSMVYFERFENEAGLSKTLLAHKEKIQAVASHKGQYPRSIPFGRLQRPELWDYADGVDTLAFLEQLK